MNEAPTATATPAALPSIPPAAPGVTPTATATVSSSPPSTHRPPATPLRALVQLARVSCKASLALAPHLHTVTQAALDLLDLVAPPRG